PCFTLSTGRIGASLVAKCTGCRRSGVASSFPRACSIAFAAPRRRDVSAREADDLAGLYRARQVQMNRSILVDETDEKIRLAVPIEIAGPLEVSSRVKRFCADAQLFEKHLASTLCPQLQMNGPAPVAASPLPSQP